METIYCLFILILRVFVDLKCLVILYEGDFYVDLF